VGIEPKTSVFMVWPAGLLQLLLPTDNGYNTLM
jgi:hypothetical protein